MTDRLDRARQALEAIEHQDYGPALALVTGSVPHRNGQPDRQLIFRCSDQSS